MPAKVRRMFHREHLSAREIARKTGLSRSTVDRWLKLSGVVEPKFAARKVLTKLDAYAETLTVWMKTNQHSGKRDRRTVHVTYQELLAMPASPPLPAVSARKRP